MNEREALQLLAEIGAIKKGHYKLVSGRHSDTYVDKDVLYTDSVATARFCQIIAEAFVHSDIDAVVAPEKGGINLTQWVPYFLGMMQRRKIFGFYAEKSREGGFIFKRAEGAARLASKRVLVVEDLLTTGGSVQKLINHLQQDIGCTIVGVGALWNRGQITVEQIGNPPVLFAVINTPIPSWTQDECPLCKDGATVDKDLGYGGNKMAA